MTAVSFPIPERAAYMKFPNPASRYALRWGDGGKDRKTGIRVAVTGAGLKRVPRYKAIEEALSANFSVDAIDESGAEESELNSDIHASAPYRKHLIGVMAKRAVAEVS